MTRSWIAVALLSAGWLYATDFYYAGMPVVAAVAAVLAVVLLARAPLRLPAPIVALVGAALALPALLVAPWPYTAIPALAMVGCLLQAARPPQRWPAALGRGALAAAAILTVQALVLFGYESLTARTPIMASGLRTLLADMFTLLGMDCAADGQELVVFAMRGKQPIAATWNLIADPITVLFLCGGVTMLALRGTAWVRKSVALTAVLAVWMPVRAALFVAVYLNRILISDYDGALATASQFWSPTWHLLLLLPAVLFARAVSGRMSPAAGAVRPPRGLDDPRRFAAPALTALAVLALTLWVVWHPSGPRKTGRVLIDEYHCMLDEWSKWRWPQKDFDTTSTLRPFDTEWYGHDSGYNYATIYEYCTRFYSMGRITKPIDDATLEECDVLLLKVPSRPYLDSEVAAVLRFVERGGGLLLMGEHTSVFGSGVNLNRIARHFGFTFRYDCLFGIDSVFVEDYTPPPVPHPIIQHMGPFDFATACSIDPGTSSGTAVIRNTGLKNLDSNYHVGNFYPTPDDAPEMIYGSFVQLWATDHQRGRVVAFSDSTIFANFSIFDRGKSQLFLGMLEWLNHAPRSLPSTVLLVLGVISLLSAIFAWRRWSGDGVLGLGAVLAGWAAAVPLAVTLHAAAMPELAPAHPLVRIGLERGLNRIILPVGGFIGGKEDGFGLFERSVQRLTEVADLPANPGRTWSTFRAAGEQVLDGDLAVFILPSREPSEAFLRRLERYVDAGGRVLVLDAVENRDSKAERLTAPFKLRIRRDEPVVAAAAKDAPPATEPISGPKGWPQITAPSALEVSGGYPLCRVGKRAVAAWIRHGKGTVTVIGFGTRFADANMGFTDQAEPTPEVRSVHDFELALLRAIVDDRLPQE